MNWLLEYVREARRTEGRKTTKAELRPTEAELRRQLAAKRKAERDARTAKR